jgi:hypothetical protein
VADTPAPPVQQESDTTGIAIPPVSHTRHTPIPVVVDTPASAKRSTTRTPVGKRRHSLYIDDTTARALDDAAARVGRQLGGMVPKHRVLAALIAAGIDQADTVAARLRAELLDTIG